MKYFFTCIVVMVLFGCNQESDSMGYKTILNTKIYYEQHGEGVPLILLSGGGINRSVRDFDKCVPDLSRKYRVILPDSPGQGKSEQPDTLTYELLTKFFSEFIDAMNLDSAYVMGWSDGGISALLLAESKPDKVKKVIAVGANNGLGGALPDGIVASTVKPQAFELWGERNKEWVDAYSKDKTKDWKKMMRSFNPMWYGEKYFPDAILTRIEIPVMIVQGDKDDIRIDHATGIHKLISNSKLYIIPNTTHEVFTERPETITKIAIDFFK